MATPSFSSFPEWAGEPSRTDRKKAKREHESGRQENDEDRKRRRERHRSRERARDHERRRDERHTPPPRQMEARERPSGRTNRDTSDGAVVKSMDAESERMERRHHYRQEAEALITGGDGSDRLHRSLPHKRVGPGFDTTDRRGTGDSDSQTVHLPADRPRLDIKDVFRDTAGDAHAVQYASSSSHVASRYHRDGRNWILGLNTGLNIVSSKNRTEKGVEIAPRGTRSAPRYHNRPLEGANEHLQRLLLRADSQYSEDFLDWDYIPFGHRRRHTDDHSEVPSYRNIDKASADPDEETEERDDALVGVSTLEQDVRKKTSEYDRHLRLHPDDIDGWIAYSVLHLRLSPEYTEKSIDSALDPARMPQSRSSAEVTISILERALQARPGNAMSTALHIAYLRAAEVYWPAKEVTTRWRKVLYELENTIRREPGTKLDERIMDVWLGYIEWREGQGFGQSEGESTGGVDEVIEVYIECLKGLAAGRLLGHSRTSTEENQLYLFLRACLFMKQAGYEERATAAFQGLMEITFFKPDHLRPTVHSDAGWFDRVLSAFDAFWDMEAPRFGDAGAQGWRNTTSDAAPSSSPAPALEKKSSDPFEGWLEAEQHATKYHSRPGRATDIEIEDEEDPYHIVLFSDIQPFLFAVRDPEVRHQLVYAYLTFMDLPFSPPEVPTSSASASDPHLRTALVTNDGCRSSFWPPNRTTKRLLWQTVGGEPMEPEAERPLVSPFQCPIKCWASERDTLFATSTRWFRDLDSQQVANLDVTSIRNSFDLLRPLIPDPNFTLAYISFEAAVEPKTAIKSAKKILAEDRHNLVLWDGYARLERQRGKVAVARTVYATALRAAIGERSQKSSVRSEDESELVAGWAEMEFEHDEPRALAVLLIAAGVDLQNLDGIAEQADNFTRPPAISILRSRQHYASLQYPMSTSDLTTSTLFHYLVDGVDAARNIIMGQLGKLPPHSFHAEQAHQLLCKILYIHTSRHATPASLARDAVELAIRSFPNNTMFMSLYLWGEMGGRVYGRVQSLISQLSTSTDAGVVGHIWAVWAEAFSAHRTFWDQGGGGAERVRQALGRAVMSKSGKHSVLLWKLYIEFETHMRRFSTAKQLCYRAVAAIGGSKDLYLMPYTAALRPHFSARELCDWAELITERGIRIRVPFENHFEIRHDESILKLPEDEEPVEDELAFLREIDGAKPYR